MQTKENNGPRVNPCGTLASTGKQWDVWPFNKTLWNPLIWIFKSIPETYSESCQTLKIECFAKIVHG